MEVRWWEGRCALFWFRGLAAPRQLRPGRRELARDDSGGVATGGLAGVGERCGVGGRWGG
jgi:hypothetical protein